jgi:hypothetical protein
MKSLHFIFYKERDYLSDRLLLLYEKIIPIGIWKFINIYNSNLLQYIPIKLQSLPAIYNVQKKELYIGEYIFEYLRSLDTHSTDQIVKTINTRIEQRDDTEIETIHKLPTINQIITDDNFRPNISKNNEINTLCDDYMNNINQEKEILLYENITNDKIKEKDIRQKDGIGGYDQSLQNNLSYSNSYDNYQNTNKTEILNNIERKKINDINNQIKFDYENLKKTRNSDLHNSHKSKNSISYCDI